MTVNTRPPSCGLCKTIAQKQLDTEAARPARPFNFYGGFSFIRKLELLH